MTNPKIDYIIVGQGIAGSMLAWFLLRQNKRIKVIDQYRPDSASRVAAGLINPITGRKMNKTWMAEKVIPFAFKSFQELEQKFGKPFLHKINIFRIFNSVKQQNDWLSKSSDLTYALFLEKDGIEKYDHPFVKNPFGGLEITNAGYVDVSTLLTVLRDYFMENDLVIEDQVSYDDIKLQESKVTWKDIKAEKMIFCEGAYGINNPWFKWLEFKLVKGEIITIKANLSLNKILNHKIWMLPLDNQTYKVGATFQWDYKNSSPSPNGLKQLTGNLKKIIDIEYSVIDHEAGIRPASYDVRPFIGLHPEHPQIGIFNGLGSKGVSLSPYFAEEFIHHLEAGKELNKEVNIKRVIASEKNKNQ